MARYPVKVIKAGDKANKWGYDVEVTRRQYLTPTAARLGAALLRTLGWEIDEKYPTRNHVVVARRRV